MSREEESKNLHIPNRNFYFKEELPYLIGFKGKTCINGDGLKHSVEFIHMLDEDYIFGEGGDKWAAAYHYTNIIEVPEYDKIRNSKLFGLIK